MRLLKKYSKNRAIKFYINRLPKILTKSYGKSKTYTPKQIKCAIEQNKLSRVYMSYGIAMFCTKPDFDLYCDESGEPHNYDTIHEEISNNYFGRHNNFTASELVLTSLDTEYSIGGHDFSGGSNGDGGD